MWLQKRRKILCVWWDEKRIMHDELVNQLSISIATDKNWSIWTMCCSKNGQNETRDTNECSSVNNDNWLTTSWNLLLSTKFLYQRLPSLANLSYQLLYCGDMSSTIFRFYVYPNYGLASGDCDGSICWLMPDVVFQSLQSLHRCFGSLSSCRIQL